MFTVRSYTAHAYITDSLSCNKPMCIYDHALRKCCNLFFFLQNGSSYFLKICTTQSFVKQKMTMMHVCTFFGMRNNGLSL